MRKPVIAGNWKMYKLLSEAVDTALALKPLVANANHCEVIIAPVFVHLKTVVDRLEGSKYKSRGARLLDRNKRRSAHRRSRCGDD
jgi:triosephosphate isomerase